MFPQIHSKVLEKNLQGVRNFLSKVGLKPTKWNSSSPEFLNSLESEIRLHPENALPPNQKVLGLPWNAALDCYVIERKLLQKNTDNRQRKSKTFTQVGGVFV